MMNDRERKARAAAARLEPIRTRLAGCAGLFARARDEIQAKMDAAIRAPTGRWAEGDEIAQSIVSDEISLRESAKLGRAIDDLQAVRASLGMIVADLEKLTGPGGKR